MNRGSEWHKWDLHVHTPESGMANRFNCTWDEYVQFLFRKAIQEDIVAIGITDYFSIDGYKRLRGDYLDNYDKLIQLFSQDEISRIKDIRVFPNVEFRLDTMVNRSRVNYHIIFSDTVRVEDIEDNFLRNIDFIAEQNPGGGPNKMKITHSNIENLGARLRMQQPDLPAGNDYTTGCTVAMVNHLQIEKLLQDRYDLFADKYIIAIPVDEDLSHISWSGQDLMLRKELYQVANVFFASNPSTIQFGLGKYHESKEQFLSEFKSFKPCIVGSDAHCLDGLFSFPLNNTRICWIKAQPTFEGLKQVLYEPAARVKIQQQKPEYKLDRQIIQSIELQQNDFWVKSIYLNQNLNTIIGGRSTGKSTLLRALAIRQNSVPEKESLSDSEWRAIEFARNYVDGVKVIWKDGLEDSNRKVEYYAQNYIYDIALDDSRLAKIIRGAFVGKKEDEILTEWETQLPTIQHKLKGMISQLFIDYGFNQKKIEEVRNIGDSKAIQESINGIKKRMEELRLNANMTDEEQKEFTKILDLLAQLRSRNLLLNKDKEQLDSLRNKSPLDIAFQDLFNVLSETPRDFLKEEYSKLSISFLKSWNTVLDECEHKWKEDIAYVQQEMSRIQESPIYRKGLTNTQSNEEYGKLQKQLTQEEENLAKINKAEEEIKGFTEQINKQKQIIVDKQVEFYTKCRELVKRITYKSEDDLLKIDAKIHFQKEIVVNVLSNRLNIRSGLVQKYIYELAKKYEDYILCEDTDNEEIYRQALRAIILELLEKLLSNDFELKRSFSSDNVATDVLSECHCDIRYMLTYDQDDFFDMSQGKKAFVVLRLLLELSDSQCPILLDQPEDSLDNRAIYRDLVKFVREKKTVRQMIVVTHNANLVVGGDAENVIVANQQGKDTPNLNSCRFDYTNGALEETRAKDENEPTILESQGIREHVCDILEGGQVAFEKREQKYGFKS